MLGCTESADRQVATSEVASKPAVSDEAATQNPASQEVVKSAPTDAETIQSVAVQVQVASHAELMERIAQAKGRAVVVDVWSTSCLPCMEEFPHLVELARRWPEDVVAISMNVDYLGLPKKPVESYIPKVTEFLSAQRADPSNLSNLVSSDPDSDLLATLEIESMPAIFIFDRDGRQVSKLTVNNAGEDGLTYAGDVLPLVEKLVNAR